MISAILRGSALSAFGLSMAGELDAAEIAAALAIGVLATALSFVYSRAARPPLRLRAQWRHLALGAAAQLAQETVEVAGALARSLVRRCRGRVVRIPLPVRPSDSAGRRAIAVLACSIAPNGFAVDAPPPGATTLRIHRLARSARPARREGDGSRAPKVGPGQTQ